MYKPKKENETYKEFENRWKAEFKESLRKDGRLRAVEESVNGGVVVESHQGQVEISLYGDYEPASARECAMLSYGADVAPRIEIDITPKLRTEFFVTVVLDYTSRASYYESEYFQILEKVKKSMRKATRNMLGNKTKIDVFHSSED